MPWWNAPLLCIVLAGLAGIAAWHLVPRRLANTRLVGQIIFFLLMSIPLLDGTIVPYEPTQGSRGTALAVLIGLAKVLWWLHFAWAVIGLVRIFLVFERRPREARLLQDVVVGMVYAGTLLSILAFVFAVPVGTLIATSGVLAVILGLALQSTLADVFSGIALNLGRTYRLGDWIVLSDGTEGRVVETNWRATHLLSIANNIIALPNSLLAKLALTNVSSPNESHSLACTIRLTPNRTPADIETAMRAVLESCDTILKEPPPLVIIGGIDAIAIEVELSFRVASLDRRVTARNQIYDLVYRHARSAGLCLALPATTSVDHARMPEGKIAGSARATTRDIIHAMSIFATLTEDETEALADSATLRTFRKGDLIVRQGATLPSLMILKKGVILRQEEKGRDGPIEIGHLAPGDFFGESGLFAGIGERFTLKALSHVEILEIDQASFAPLLHKRPEMAEDLAATLSARMSASAPALHPKSQARSQQALRQAIRSAFQIMPLRRSARSPTPEEG